MVNIENYIVTATSVIAIIVQTVKSACGFVKEITTWSDPLLVADVSMNTVFYTKESTTAINVNQQMNL